MKIWVLFFLMVVSCSGYAQAVVGGVQSKGMDMNAIPGGMVKEIHADTKEVIGNVYLYERWLLGSIDFINGAKLTNKSIRYNIDTDVLEIKADTGLKGADGKNVKAFEIQNDDVRERYVSAMDFKFGSTRLLGFLKELHVGVYSLYSKTNVKLVKGTYVAALDMGEEDDTYSKRTIYYLVKEKELMEINVNKKKFAALFPGREDKIMDYINKSDLYLKREADLVKAVAYANTLPVE